jgi:hypothetical protein
MGDAITCNHQHTYMESSCRFDCRFFMLKNLEGCGERKPASLSQKDIPNIRKLLTDRWLHGSTKLSRCLSVFWIPGYPSPRAPRPLQWPSFGLGAKWRPKPSKEEPHEKAPHEENDDKTAKDQKTLSRGAPHEERDQIYASSAQSCVEREDKIRRWCTVHATPTRGRPASTVPA